MGATFITEIWVGASTSAIALAKAPGTHLILAFALVFGVTEAANRVMN